MTKQNGKKPVPPFVDEEAERRKLLARRGVGSLFMMLIGWAGLTLAMLGVAKVLIEYFLDLSTTSKDIQISLVWAQFIILGLAYAVGWALSFISIHRQFNTTLAMIVRIYSFFIAAAILFVYVRAAYRIFWEQDITISKYILVLLAGYIGLVSLHVLLDENDLPIFSFVFFLAAFVHLLTAVIHYVFTDPKQPNMVWADILFFMLMAVLIALLRAEGLYRPFKELIRGQAS